MCVRGLGLCVVVAAVLVGVATPLAVVRPLPTRQRPSVARRFTPVAADEAVSDEPVAVDPRRVVVLPDAEDVADEVFEMVEEAARVALETRGAFALGVPGGSVLKMLKREDDDVPEWAAQTTIAWVNHKCVPTDDLKLATTAKARGLFLDAWGSAGCSVVDLTGTADADAEAAAYETKLRSLAATGMLPVDDDGYPIFDCVLIGVGDDGHVGSLYPNRDEVLDASGKWVLPVKMKDPPSITLSLPVMQRANLVVVAACGVSEKYPQGKSDAMKRAVETDESLQSFPASGLRGVATYIFDDAAASKLSPEYQVTV